MASAAMQQKRAAYSVWTRVSSPPVLADGEIGWDITNNQARMGNGSSLWASLPIIGSGSTSLATSTTMGSVELFSDTLQSVAANSVTATASRTYGLQLNSSGQGVINVPWTDTVYSLPDATASVKGGVIVGTTLSVSSGTINLPTTGITATSYTYPNITVDAYGRITTISSGTAPSFGYVGGYQTTASAGSAVALTAISSVTSGTGVTLSLSSAATTGTASGGISITTGATTSAGNSGSIYIDSGTAATSVGSIGIGTNPANLGGSGNATTIGIGRTGVTTTTIYGTLTATASSATNLTGTTQYSKPYQSASGVTSYLSSPTTNGTYVMTSVPSASVAVAPTWSLASGLSVSSATTANSASNLSGGVSSHVYIPYQSNAGTTSYVVDTTATSGQVLTYQGGSTSPTWTSPTSVNFSGSGTSVTGVQSAAGVALPISTANNTTASGAITIATGQTSLSSLTTGSVTINTGDSNSSGGNSGAITIKTGAGSGSGGNSGAITIDSGVFAGTGTAGSILIGNTNSPTLTIGRSGATVGINGTTTITGQTSITALAVSTTPGSSQSITGGATTNTGGIGGSVTITGGAATTGTSVATGGSVSIIGGASNTTAGVGGSVTINAGLGSGPLNNGNGLISIGTANTDSITIGASGKSLTLNGTLTAVPTFPSQTANLIFAGPASGSAAAPTFRQFSSNDLATGAAIGQSPVAAPSGTGWSWVTPITTSGGTQTFTAASTLTTSTSTTGDTPAITLSTGTTSFNTGTTGAISIATGSPTTAGTAASSGVLSISTGNAAGSSAGVAGAITITAGNGSGSSGVGGSISLNAGVGVTTGSVNIGTTSGNITIGRTASNFAPKLPTPFINTSQTALTATATITAANVLTKNIYLATATTAVTFTLDNGTNFDNGFGSPAIGSTVEWFVINEGTSAATITMAGGTNHTFRGTTTIAIATAAKFITRKSAANTYFTYRV